MFFHQGAKQNKGLKALVTTENVQKLMLNVKVVIFRTFFTPSLGAEAFLTVWMIFCEKVETDND